MSPSFPLLHLPPEAILRVIQSMDYGEFITFSFLSKRAKCHVESMNLKHRAQTVTIGNPVNISMIIGNKSLVWKFSLNNIPVEQTNISLSLLDKVDLVTVNGTSRITEWSMEGLNIRNWYTHFKTIFGLSTYRILRFQDNPSMFEIAEVRATFEPFDKLVIERYPGLDECLESTLKNFPSRNVFFDNGSIDHLKQPQQILIQNYDDLEIYNLMNIPIALTLDDLLVINAKRIDVGDINLTEKDINRFLKHWIRGSNPRLEMIYIYLLLRKAPNQADILKGIKYLEVPHNHVRFFKTCPEHIKGGFDFHRKDGTRATIKINFDEISGRRYYWLAMYVWHPHCVGDGK
ncbi:hypothetical protein CRE_24765 [Caenorhabditis remanei]|uniref:F-box domain-containing protein n=1 Tax=Caenorhabditis remanei TaxID=31234 RepID=E3NCS8_CAERE|nr:hypothetical protein CRE_24765 [Caenorhabditis remanei]